MLALSLAAATALPAQGIRDEGSFVKTIKEAFARKDARLLDPLTWTQGMSDTDRVRAGESRGMLFADTDVENVSLGPLPKNQKFVHVMNGLRIEPTHPPTGKVVLALKQASGAKATASMLYAVINGGFYLVTSKSTDLHWKGPPDKNISYMVSGTGQDRVRLSLKFNASGVEMEDTPEYPSGTFWGQHVTEMEVRSDDPGVEVELTISEDGKSVYKSEKLKGVGSIKYKRKA